MKYTITQRVIMATLLISFVAAIVCEVLYHASGKQPIDMQLFSKQLTKKQVIAEKTINELKKILTYHEIDSLFQSKFPSNDISYYLFNTNKELIYWSANFTDLTNLSLQNAEKWTYFNAANAHCISKFTNTKVGVLVSVIRIKNNYTYQNNQLINNFVSGFDVDKRVVIEVGKKTDTWAVVDYRGNYLFSFKLPNQAILNQTLGFTGFLLQVIFLVCLLLILARFQQFFKTNTLNLRQFIIFFSILLLTVLASLYFKFPHLLYYEVLSSAFDYSSSFLIASIIHLTVVTAFVFVSLYVLFSHVTISLNHKQLKAVALQLVSALFFILIFYILKGLVLHSGMPINILSLHDFGAGVVWLHFLMLLWGISHSLLFFKSHNYSVVALGIRKMIRTDLVLLLVFASLVFMIDYEYFTRVTLFYIFLTSGFYIPYFWNRKKNYYILSGFWVLFFTLFLVENSAMLTKKKTESKYRVLAENIYLNGNSGNERVTEIMLEELNNQLLNDAQIGNFIQTTDSTENLINYLTANYFRGYWNKYTIQFSVLSPNTILYGQNKNLLDNTGIPIGNTNFFSFSSTLNELAYRGEFRLSTADGKVVSLFINLTPRKNFRSYSFPTFLISSEMDIQAKLNIAIARYRNQRLVYSSGSYAFPEKDTFIPLRKNLFYKYTFHKKTYYVYQPDKANSILITELNQYQFLNYLIYFSYLFLVNLAITFLFVWLINGKKKATIIHSSLSSKYQFAFVILLLVSFIGIFYVSVTFISSNYKEQQIAEIDKKKSYIQQALQEKYYWTQDIATVSSQGLNFDLQELSYLYKTDINVYDNYGRLVGSSQPLIYNKKLISKQIAPEPFFGKNANLNQEEYIGALRFTTGYTDFYNGDYLQIGYISIPLFVSTEEIRSEIEDFLAVIVHIYLIIALLSVLLSFIIGRQLSAPLKMIENKLKKMRFGQRNEKIEYNEHDEIGQLVKQYNKTIEELERSAQLLAQTERESAWRTMARQIAHEINNPLTPMKLTLQQLQRTKKMNDGRFDDYFEKSTITLVEQIDNLSRIAGTFSNFARMPEARFERMDVAAKLYSTVRLFETNNEEIDIEYIGSNAKVFVVADPEQMLQVFTNFLKNAIQAIPTNRKGQITVRLTTRENEVEIAIADNGKGIPKEIQDKVFTPNFTTKSMGMGLGLAITKNIIEMTGGSISFTTTENKGSEFKVRLKRD